jgi:hypothetical protein
MLEICFDESHGVTFEVWRLLECYAVSTAVLEDIHVRQCKNSLVLWCSKLLRLFSIMLALYMLITIWQFCAVNSVVLFLIFCPCSLKRKGNWLLSLLCYVFMSLLLVLTHSVPCTRISDCHNKSLLFSYFLIFIILAYPLINKYVLFYTGCSLTFFYILLFTIWYIYIYI